MGNATSSVAVRFAFFPPEPATYGKNVEVRGQEATFWSHLADRFTLLYSHGNCRPLSDSRPLRRAMRPPPRQNHEVARAKPVLLLLFSSSSLIGQKIVSSGNFSMKKVEGGTLQYPGSARATVDLCAGLGWHGDVIELSVVMGKGFLIATGSGIR
ncbi:hypothetical protein ZIOFF_014821 [Zingiber officinale]|uniref:Uncharacterized protein n=1 Tax=Zingiber officinale TaxID=94328 RepID=A0A8J5HHW4_ZINOF|nr:hypothetical protein ZIOFF_014821 [Zingiber officinale]